MRKILTLVGATVGLGLAGSATAAEDLNYSYIDLGYAYTEYNDYRETFGLDVEGSGAVFRGSLAVASRVHAFLDWSDQSFNHDEDIETMGVGLGYHHSLTPRVDAILSVMYLQAKTDPDVGFGVEDDGMGFELGLRGHLVGNWEMEGSVRYASISTFIDDTVFRLATRYNFNRNFGLNFGADFSNEQAIYTAGFRLSFQP